MQFAITAYDFPGEDTLARRMANREEHLAGLVDSIKNGQFLSGGALLNDQGQMVGSSVHVQFPDLEAVQKWLAKDPYSIAKVWEKIEIKEVRLFSPSV